VILASLESAAAEHPELVQRYLGSAVTPEDGKFAAMSNAFWSGGVLLYVPRNVRVETPVRLYRWLSGAGTAAFGRLLIVAEAGAEIAIVDELASDAMTSPTLSVSAAEIVAEEGAKVTYVAVQRFGAGVSHLSTDRLVAGRDARITSLYTSLGGDRDRADAQCRPAGAGRARGHAGRVHRPGRRSTSTTRRCRTTSRRTRRATCLFKGALQDTGRSCSAG
jgi:Fe-S cluster assembly protein SufD